MKYNPLLPPFGKPWNLKAEPTWIDRHSVNCFICGLLVDERDCIPGPDFEGDICLKCQQIPAT